jgi:hypothetical protein
MIFGRVLHFTILDLTKAYDVVNHDMLLNKLDSYGIRGVPFNVVVVLTYKWYIHCYNQTIYNHNVFSTAIFIDLYDIMDLPNVAIVINGMNKKKQFGKNMTSTF